MLRRESGWSDSGWIGADADDDLDQRLAAEAELFDPLQPHIMTALGPISPDSLGPTLVGDQTLGYALATDLDENDLPGPATLAVADHLRAYTDAGGGSIVVATTPGGGRDTRSLRWLAAWTPVHLIVVTGGGGSDRARTAGAGTTGADERGAAMMTELTHGIEGTSLRAGVILIELQHPVLSDDDKAWLRAATVAAKATGSAIMLSVEHPSDVPPALADLANYTIDVSRLTVEWRTGDDIGDAAKVVLAVGASWVINPRVAGLKATERQVRRVVDLVDRGYGKQLLLGAGTIGRSVVNGTNGPSWVTMLERMPIHLMEAGLDAATVRSLLVENPMRMVTIVRGER